ncbi:MAG: site-2 protease family protein [Treponema sp.]|nr:site-2 protease family protein [Treponema sp.]
MTIIIGIVGLGFLVFFHELGHFIAAQALGVKVLAFSVGMGPVLLHKEVGGTDYRLSMIPLGGYCAMKGENDFKKAMEENRKSIEGDSDSFYGVHPLKRLLIAFAGPFFNLVFGFIAFLTIAMMGYSYYSAGTQVSMADEIYEGMASPAHEAGMMSGDIIKAMNGKDMETFVDLQNFIAIHSDEDIRITLERDGEIMELTVHSLLDKETGMGKLGIVSSVDSIIETHYGPFSFPAAVVEGAKQCGSFIALTFKGIAILFKGVDVTNVISGPVRMTTMLGDTVKQGFAEGAHVGIISSLQILAFISISLFITNLLPIPILDGGLILFAFIEIVARRKMHPKLLYYIQYVGIAFVALLLVLALTGDVRYLIANYKK